MILVLSIAIIRIFFAYRMLLKLLLLSSIERSMESSDVFTIRPSIFEDFPSDIAVTEYFSASHIHAGTGNVGSVR